jgi:hypothetical protein
MNNIKSHENNLMAEICSFLDPLREVERRFVWRRAFRSPGRCVVRSDLVEAFGMSENKASALLTSEAKTSGGKLVREGYKVVAPAFAEPSQYADGADLMRHLQGGLSDYRFTGLKSDELPINRTPFSNPLPPQAGAFERIVQAIATRGTLYIRYVSMKSQDEGRWRRVAPLSLDCVGDQWRVTAQDLDNLDEQFPVRSFVLARIIEVSPDPKRPPKGFIRGSGFDSKQLVSLEMNPMLTKPQKEVIRHELGIEEGRPKDIPQRCVHEFLIRFADSSPSRDATWPPLRTPKKL